MTSQEFMDAVMALDKKLCVSVRALDELLKQVPEGERDDMREELVQALIDERDAAIEALRRVA